MKNQKKKKKVFPTWATAPSEKSNLWIHTFFPIPLISPYATPRFRQVDTKKQKKFIFHEIACLNLTKAKYS